MQIVRLLVVVVAVSCGGAVEDPRPVAESAPVPTPVVIRGRLQGETADCGVSGHNSTDCYVDSLAREVWLLARSDAEYCGGATYPEAYECSTSERRPLVQVRAAEDGRFVLATVEGEYRLAVIDNGTVRPAWEDATFRAGRIGDGGFTLTAERFFDDELFHFDGQRR